MMYNYITNSKGLGGRIKQISNDFIVSEIGENYVTDVLYLPDKRVEEIDWKKIFLEREGEDYLVVDLEKNNISTTTAISQFARFLRVSKKRISYAGLKDKRAITSQKLSVFNPPEDRISKFYFKNIKIYNPMWSDKRINIGDLKQNKFKVTIRKVTKSEKEIQDIIKNTFSQIELNSLINYFGEQRFGGVREITHKVGKFLLKKDYRSAVILYLTESFDLEREDIKKARNELKEDLNFGKHAAYFPAKTGYEKAMLNYLANNSEDFLGAIKVLPKSIQYLFIHAYQSYIFNELINLRIKKGFGPNKIDGDKVIDDKVYLPLIGFESEFSEGKAGELEKKFLEEEGITFKDFYNKEYPVLSSKGNFRELKTKVYDLKLLSIDEDELNQEELPNSKKITISFKLDKGRYATNLLRELIKPKGIWS